MKMSKSDIVRKTIKTKDSPVIPYHITFLKVMEERVKNYFGGADADDLAGNYIKWSGIKGGWTKAGERLERDAFGVLWRTNPFNRGSVVEPFLKEPDLNKMQIPDYHYDQILKDLSSLYSRDKEYYHVMWAGDLFERALMLRGTEEGLTDFYLNPNFVKGLLEILTQVILKNIQAVKDLDLPGVFLSDDYGTQSGLLISKSMWQKFIKPHLKQIVDYAHKYGKQFFLHSDGKIAELIPDFIDLGIDVLHPVQSETMDFKALKKKYGKDICFYGGLGTQSLLRTGDPKKIKEEVRKLITLENSAHSFILAPTLQLMEDIPFPNILSLMEVLRKGF